MPESGMVMMTDGDAAKLVQKRFELDARKRDPS
jgi:hypothetical protein